MILKEHVRERIERIIELTDARADAEIIRGEEAMSGGTSYASIGFAVGARFVRDMILDEFDFLFPDGDYIDEDYIYEEDGGEDDT